MEESSILYIPQTPPPHYQPILQLCKNKTISNVDIN